MSVQNDILILINSDLIHDFISDKIDHINLINKIRQNCFTTNDFKITVKVLYKLFLIIKTIFKKYDIIDLNDTNNSFIINVYLKILIPSYELDLISISMNLITQLTNYTF